MLRDERRLGPVAVLVVEVSVTLHAAAHSLAPVRTMSTDDPGRNAATAAVEMCRRFLGAAEAAVNQLLLELARHGPASLVIDAPRPPDVTTGTVHRPVRRSPWPACPALSSGSVAPAARTV